MSPPKDWRIAKARRMLAEGSSRDDVVLAFGLRRNSLARYFYKHGADDLGAVFSRMSESEFRCRRCRNYFHGKGPHCMTCLPKSFGRFDAIVIKQDDAGHFLLKRFVEHDEELGITRWHVTPLQPLTGMLGNLWPRRHYRRARPARRHA